MRLERIRKNVWDVLAVLDSTDTCVIDLLLGCTGKELETARKMLALLRERVPDDGPPRQNEHFCTPLGPNSFKFKRGPRKGQKLRVAWFYDSGRVVICTVLYWKGSETPQWAIDQTEALRAEYMEAKRTGQLEIVEDED